MWLRHFTSSSAVCKSSCCSTSLTALGMSVFFILGILITVQCYHIGDLFCISLVSYHTATLNWSHRSSPAWTIIGPNWSLCIQFDLLKIPFFSFLCLFLFQPPLWDLPLLYRFNIAVCSRVLDHLILDMTAGFFPIQLQLFQTWWWFLVIHLSPRALLILRYTQPIACQLHSFPRLLKNVRVPLTQNVQQRTQHLF